MPPPPQKKTQNKPNMYVWHAFQGHTDTLSIINHLQLIWDEFS